MPTQLFMIMECDLQVNRFAADIFLGIMLSPYRAHTTPKNIEANKQYNLETRKSNPPRLILKNNGRKVMISRA